MSRKVPEYFAGNKITVDRIFTRLPGSAQSVNPSTVHVWVDHPDGTATVLVQDTDFTVSYTGDGISEVTVVADWTVPDDTPGGVYNFVFRVTGNLIARTQVPVFIIEVARPEPPTP